MRKLLLLITVLHAGALLQAQVPGALKKVLELKMPLTADDDMAGTRGASLVWHPVQKKYYASFAGNAEFPMAVFDAQGKRLNEENLVTMVDTRGLWYDPTAKAIYVNGYSDWGWFYYKLAEDGIPFDIISVKEGMYQPNPHASGVYNAATRQILFLSQSRVFFYDNEGKPVDSIGIHWGRKQADGPADDEDLDAAHEDYNETAVVYTGISKQEIGFLNITNRQVELYNIETGYLTKTLTLPETATTEPMFNFAYANGIYWLFDIELRTWVGYK